MAVIPVSPVTDLSALIASDNVSPGDVLVLSDGVYFQTVNVTKDHLRIVANGKKAVFNGKGLLQFAFILKDVTGVEINGISIMHYRVNGILIFQGGSHRIVRNKINRLLDVGIVVSSSSDNFLWKNEICHALEGIQLIAASVNNRVVENMATLCEGDGFETFSTLDSNNALIGNVAVNNSGYGMESYGDNNLLANNILVGNAIGGLSINPGSNSVAVGNVVKDNRSRGCVLLDHPNLFLGENKVENNRRQGMVIAGLVSNGVVQQNKVKHNTDSGLVLTGTTESNLIFNNRLQCNIPANLVDNGRDNHYFANGDEPCGPDELSFQDCPCSLTDFPPSRTGKQEPHVPGSVSEHPDQ